ncbi:MAG: nucleoside deaminase [Gammaproteobacteria bacterium]|nr:nucleoside deaminase [Pseudomonadota bacterium]MCH9664155.1 nucleoside deaminase [Gammaproteobacteria bacterium]
MRLSLDLARQARSAGEVPVGAVIRLGHRIVAAAHNETILACDPSAHAEIVALRRASARVGSHRLPDCVMYVSLEPCAMCAGAMIQARIRELVYACDDVRFGAFSGRHSILECLRHNHKPQVRGGLMASPARTLLKDFFQQRRQRAGGA